MATQDVYLGLGGNIGDTKEIFRSVVKALKEFSDCEWVGISKLYRTSPVSAIPQPFFLNAACRLRTTSNLEFFFERIERLEKAYGKKDKTKDEPRTIDIDLLFFGKERRMDQKLCLPHPRWGERLFVLIPLLDLTPIIHLPLDDHQFEEINLLEKIRTFDNKQNECVLFDSFL